MTLGHSGRHVEGAPGGRSGREDRHSAGPHLAKPPQESSSPFYGEKKKQSSERSLRKEEGQECQEEEEETREGGREKEEEEGTEKEETSRKRKDSSSEGKESLSLGSKSSHQENTPTVSGGRTPHRVFLHASPFASSASPGPAEKKKEEPEPPPPPPRDGRDGREERKAPRAASSSRSALPSSSSSSVSARDGQAKEFEVCERSAVPQDRATDFEKKKKEKDFKKVEKEEAPLESKERRDLAFFETYQPSSSYSAVDEEVEEERRRHLHSLSLGSQGYFVFSRSSSRLSFFERLKEIKRKKGRDFLGR